MYLLSYFFNLVPGVAHWAVHLLVSLYGIRMYEVLYSWACFFSMVLHLLLRQNTTRVTRGFKVGGFGIVVWDPWGSWEQAGLAC